MSNWSARPLRREQMVYAAMDAYILILLFDEMRRRAESVCDHPLVRRGYGSQLAITISRGRVTVAFHNEETCRERGLPFDEIVDSIDNKFENEKQERKEKVRERWVTVASGGFGLL